MTWLEMTCLVAICWIGMIGWYFIGKGQGYAAGYKAGAADMRAEIIAGFDKCLADGDLKIYVRKGAESEIHEAVIKIGDMPIGAPFDGGVRH